MATKKKQPAKRTKFEDQKLPTRYKATAVGLPGTRKETKLTFVTSPTDAARFLRAGQSVTAAGDDGAMIVWRDVDGNFRCEFYQRLSTKDSRNFRYLASAAAWMKEFWPRLRY